MTASFSHKLKIVGFLGMVALMSSAFSATGTIKSGLCVIVTSDDVTIINACSKSATTCNSDGTCTIDGFSVGGTVTGPMLLKSILEKSANHSKPVPGTKGH